MGRDPGGVCHRVGGVDFGFIPGPGIFSHLLGPAAGATSVRQAWDAIRAGVGIAAHATGCPELGSAIDAFGGRRPGKSPRNPVVAGA